MYLCTRIMYSMSVASFSLYDKSRKKTFKINDFHMKSSSKSLPLITVNEKEEFIVHEEAIQLLNKYHTPIAVVAVAGKYRTGKSYLLNILTGDSCGFEVGNTVNACTKGALYEYMFIYC